MLRSRYCLHFVALFLPQDSNLLGNTLNSPFTIALEVYNYLFSVNNCQFCQQLQPKMWLKCCCCDWPTTQTHVMPQPTSYTHANKALMWRYIQTHVGVPLGIPQYPKVPLTQHDTQNVLILFIYLNYIVYIPNQLLLTFTCCQKLRQWAYSDRSPHQCTGMHTDASNDPQNLPRHAVIISKHQSLFVFPNK